MTAGGGNWLDTRMQSLAGMFAGILLVAVPAEKAGALVAALKRLDTHGLQMVVETAADAPPAQPARMAKSATPGSTDPGIVRDLSRVLADRHVSIVDLETEREAASFSASRCSRRGPNWPFPTTSMSMCCKRRSSSRVKLDGPPGLRRRRRA